MAFTKKNYVDLTGLSTFKTSFLGTVINDSNKTTTNKTATIKAIADYVDSEVADLSSAVTTELAKKVSSVTYDSTNKKLVYNKGGSTNTDIVTVATLKSAIGTFVKSGSGASAGLVPAPSKTAGSLKYLREDGTWATPPDTNTTYVPATTSQAGLMSADDKTKLDGITASADSVSFTRSLSSGTKVGTITINGTATDLYAPTNTDIHYTAKNVVSSSNTGTANVTAVTDNPYINLIENGAVRSTHRISGSGATTVKTDTSGNIIISSTDTNTTYVAATTKALGLVKSQTTGTTSNRNYGVEVNTDGTMKVNVPWTDTKVTSTANNTTKAYLVGSTSSSTSTDTLIKDTNIYLDTTAGKLVATTFSGSLSGNASSSTNASYSAKIGSSSNHPAIGSESQPVYVNASGVITAGTELGTMAYEASENYLASSLKGVSNGVASLDANGLVPSSQLPSYVDDVLEYSAKSNFPSPGEAGKIYVDTSSNLTYRWSGSAYVEISPSLALGETSSTAYAGDKGKTLATNLSNHTGNTTVHITASERTSWNGKENASNKVKSWSSTTTDDHYPSEKLVKDSLDGKYAKPSGGIPKSDLASAVQTSLGKADTALQAHQDISGKENTSNKVKSWSSTTTDDHYPSEKLVKDSLDSVYSAINNFDYRGRVNTWSAVNTFSNGSDVTSGSSTASGAIIASNGGIWAAGGIRGNRVYNAVWNDLADCIPVDEECELTPGYCYCFDGEKYYKSSKYLDDGIIGIHSDTYGMHMGYKDNCKQMDVAVAGFVLAYVDKEYPSGTPLTCTENGYLTKIEKSDKIEYPEKIVATYWKNEPSEYWGGEKDKIKVNGRKWVKIK